MKGCLLSALLLLAALSCQGLVLRQTGLANAVDEPAKQQEAGALTETWADKQTQPEEAEGADAADNSAENDESSTESNEEAGAEDESTDVPEAPVVAVAAPAKTEEEVTSMESKVDQRLAVMNVFPSSCNDVFMNLVLDAANATYMCDSLNALKSLGPAMSEWDLRCSKANQAAIADVTAACAHSLSTGRDRFDEYATALACSFFPAHPLLDCDNLPAAAQQAYYSIADGAESGGGENAPWYAALKKAAEAAHDCGLRKGAKTTQLLQLHFKQAAERWGAHTELRQHSGLLAATRAMFMAMDDLASCVCDKQKTRTVGPLLRCYKEHGEAVARGTSDVVGQSIKVAKESAAFAAKEGCGDSTDQGTAHTSSLVGAKTRLRPHSSSKVVHVHQPAVQHQPGQQAVHRAVAMVRGGRQDPKAVASAAGAAVNALNSTINAVNSTLNNLPPGAELLLPVGDVRRALKMAEVLQRAPTVIRAVQNATQNAKELKAQWEALAAGVDAQSLAAEAQRLVTTAEYNCRLYPLPGGARTLPDGSSLPSAVHGTFGCGARSGPVDVFFTLEFWAGATAQRTGTFSVNAAGMLQLESFAGVALSGVPTVLTQLQGVADQATRIVGFGSGELRWVVNKILELFDRKMSLGSVAFALSTDNFSFTHESSSRIALLELAVFRLELDPKLAVVVKFAAQCPAVRVDPGIIIKRWSVVYCQACASVNLGFRRVKKCTSYPCGSEWTQAFSYYPFNGKWALTHECTSQLV